MIKRYLALLSVPLFLLAVSLSLRVFWNVFDLPPAQVLADTIAGWLSRYGLPVLFLAAMAEGTLLVGGYFPGVFIITVAVIVARSWQEAVVAVIVGSLGLIAAHIVNYQLGRHGWYRLLSRFGLKGPIAQARHRLEKRGLWALFATYWMPSIAALTDTAAGIMAIPFRRFLVYAVAATFLWDTIAGTVMYLLGSKAIEIATPNGTDMWIVLPILGAWMLGLIIWDWRKRRSSGQDA